MADDDGTGTSSVGRLMFRPVRAVAAPTIERAVDGIFASTVPESVAQSLAEHRVVQRVVRETLARTDVDAELRSALESEEFERALRDVLTSPALERALRSPEFGRVLEQILGSPQVRHALAQTSTSLAEETAAHVRGASMRLDERVERRPRRWFRRSPHSPLGTPFAGVATRAAALALDAFVVTLLFLVGAAVVNVVTSLVGDLRPTWLATTLGFAAWGLLVAVYFVGFWSATGQTPAMRVMHLRVVVGADAVPGVVRSSVRLVGLVLSIIPCFAGFLPALVDDRRRGLADFLAGTTVLYDEPAFARIRSSEQDEAAAVAPT